ncbi:hypothetical protein N7490_009462 [Penicillium lividum]|nr:hypothetical protein N7490_009462 [Penicillium lividum]
MTQSAVLHNDFVIPLIDFSLFLNGAPKERLETAKAILDGFRKAGFVYLRNLPMSPSERQDVFETSAKFFGLPLDEKKRLDMPSIQSNRGYNATGQEKLNEGLPDIKESLHIGRENDPEYANIWPSEAGELIGFKKTIGDFYDFCGNIAVEVMRAIALGLEIDEKYFDSYMSFGDHKLRLLHYPHVERSVFNSGSGQVRAGEHTDYGAVTLLFQDGRGGLQVKTPAGDFVNASPIENTVVVNAGDLLARWSNDVMKSTVHRVVEPPMVEGEVYPARYSIAFFANPNEKSYIDAIPGTFATEAEKKYKGTTSGDYYLERLNATY